MAITIYNNGGSPESDFHQYSSLKISQSIHGHHSFNVLLPHSTQYDSLQEVSHLIGNKIKFDIEGGTQMVGVITKVNFKNNVEGKNRLLLNGYSPSIFWENNLKCRSFLDKNLKDIITEIKDKDGEKVSSYLKDSGDFIIKDSQPNPKKIAYSVQYKETIFAYVSRLADTYGKWFFYNGEKIFFSDKPPQSPTISLKLGENLFTIDVQLQLSTPQLNYSFHNYEDDKPFKGEAKIGDVSSKDELTEKALEESKAKLNIDGSIPSELHFTTEDELQTWTKTKLKSHSSNAVKFIGTSNEPTLKVGSLIKISSKKENGLTIIPTQHGTYRVTRVIHTAVSEEIYSNSFEAIPQEMEVAPKNPFVTLPSCEPQSAIVLESKEADNKKLGRVKVKFRWQGEEETPWIRVGSPYTNKGDGIYFLPEEGEEVLVNFEYNNPDLPYVENSLFNGASPPKHYHEKNYFKVISTAKGSEIFISDEDGKEVINIRNKEESCFVKLDLKDKKIMLQAEEIELSSEGDIKLTAKGDVTINAKGKMKLGGDGGTTVDTKGKMEINAVGSTTVKGMPINLNP